MAEILGVRRPTVERRLLRFGEHARAFHEHLLECQRLRGGLRCQTVQMDELETYETDRRLQPVTVPVLIDPRTFFILHIDTAPMPARGGLRPRDQIRRQERERRQGRRKSGSRSAVLRTLQAWKHFGGPEPGKMLQSDKKQTYRAALRKVFGAEPVHHATVKSGVVRNRNNLLFPINHTNALLRDSVSRLVRRTWAASKKRRPLEHHLWLFVIFRNYIREITRRCAEVTSATALGVTRRKLGWSEVLRWRAPFFTLCRAT